MHLHLCFVLGSFQPYDSRWGK